MKALLAVCCLASTVVSPDCVASQDQDREVFEHYKALHSAFSEVRFEDFMRTHRSYRHGESPESWFKDGTIAVSPTVASLTPSSTRDPESSPAVKYSTLGRSPFCELLDKWTALIGSLSRGVANAGQAEMAEKAQEGMAAALRAEIEQYTKRLQNFSEQEKNFEALLKLKSSYPTKPLSVLEVDGSAGVKVVTELGRLKGALALDDLSDTSISAAQERLRTQSAEILAWKEKISGLQGRLDECVRLISENQRFLGAERLEIGKTLKKIEKLKGKTEKKISRIASRGETTERAGEIAAAQAYMTAYDKKESSDFSVLAKQADALRIKALSPAS